MRSLLARDKDKLLRKNQLSRSLRRRLPVPKDSGTQGQGLAPGEQMRQWGREITPRHRGQVGGTILDR